MDLKLARSFLLSPTPIKKNEYKPHVVDCELGLDPVRTQLKWHHHNPRIADQHMQRQPFFQKLPRAFPRLVQTLQIQLQELQLWRGGKKGILGLDLEEGRVDGSKGALLGTTGQEDMGTASRQCDHGSVSQPCVGAGDDGDFFGQVWDLVIREAAGLVWGGARGLPQGEL